jgi:hypothetical protein
VRTANGTITAFDAPGASYETIALSINTVGDIAGFYADGKNVSHGFVRRANGAMTVFDAPSAGTDANQGTFVLSVNAAEVIMFGGDSTGPSLNDTWRLAPVKEYKTFSDQGSPADDGASENRAPGPRSGDDVAVRIETHAGVVTVTRHRGRMEALWAKQIP